MLRFLEFENRLLVDPASATEICMLPRAGRRPRGFQAYSCTVSAYPAEQLPCQKPSGGFIFISTHSLLRDRLQFGPQFARKRPRPVWFFLPAQRQKTIQQDGKDVPDRTARFRSKDLRAEIKLQSVAAEDPVSRAFGRFERPGLSWITNCQLVVVKSDNELSLRKPVAHFKGK